MQQTQVILDAKQISKSYIGVQALKGVDFALHKGEVRCLVGENGSGKSTLVKIISGAETPTSGSIVFNGKAYEKLTSSDAMAEGIQVIYQDLCLFDHMSVADNIAMGKIVMDKKAVLSKTKIRQIAGEILDFIDVSIPLDVPVREVSIANKQLIAICRCLVLNAKLLFLDEPTTALTKPEIDRLLEIVLGLKERGITVVFISHKLDEVMKISDTITVLRDGEMVGNYAKRDVDEKKLAYYMTGRDVTYSQYCCEHDERENLLELRQVSKKGHYEQVDLSVRRGDIVGLIGLLGSGRTELALSIFGLNKPDSGQMLFEGSPIAMQSPMDAQKIGIALVPEDRSTQGLFLGKQLDENIVAVILKKITTKFGVLNKKRQKQISADGMKQYNIKAYSDKAYAGTLSGGNQQKLVLAKWSATNPKLLMLDSPTVGVDIGSKAEIYTHIQNFAKQGTGVILITDEISEALANCNRLLVMFEGRVVYEFSEAQLRQEGIEREINRIVETGETEGPEGGRQDA